MCSLRVSVIGASTVARHAGHPLMTPHRITLTGCQRLEGRHSNKTYPLADPRPPTIWHDADLTYHAAKSTQCGSLLGGFNRADVERTHLGLSLSKTHILYNSITTPVLRPFTAATRGASRRFSKTTVRAGGARTSAFIAIMLHSALSCPTRQRPAATAFAMPKRG